MTIPPPNSHSTREGSGEMFDQIAARYDLLNRVMSLGMDRWWRWRAVAALGLRQDHRILDLATGTADLAISVARQHPTLRVTGLDPSQRMLDVGMQKLARLGMTNQVQLVVGDAQSIAFPDRSFDGVCMAFGIRNVPDRSAALREIARVVRPGGRVSILELSEPGDGWLAGPARWYVRRVIPWLGGLLSGAREYRYLQRSIAAFPPAADFSRQMLQAGLDVLRVERLGFGACHLYVASPTESRA